MGDVHDWNTSSNVRKQTPKARTWPRETHFWSRDRGKEDLQIRHYDGAKRNDLIKYMAVLDI